MAAYSVTRSKPKRSRRIVLLLAVATVMCGIGAGVLWAVRSDQTPPKKAVVAPPPKEAAAEPTPPKPPLVNLQPVVDQWVAKQSGDYGIVVYDPANQQVVATHQGDKQFFTASIYKLYVVYLALQDVDAGKHVLGEQFRAGKTRQTCLYDAIHSSDSPCAEALMAEIGNAAVNERLRAFGLAHTAFPSFVTSATDTIKVLERLQARKDLNEASTNLMLDPMKNQIYRNGLPKGMPQAVVADKVGFSETPHYHDVGIVTLPNGREYLVAYFSQNSNSRTAASFGTTLYAALQGS